MFVFHILIRTFPRFAVFDHFTGFLYFFGLRSGFVRIFNCFVWAFSLAFLGVRGSPLMFGILGSMDSNTLLVDFIQLHLPGCTLKPSKAPCFQAFPPQSRVFDLFRENGWNSSRVHPLRLSGQITVTAAGCRFLVPDLFQDFNSLLFPSASPLLCFLIILPGALLRGFLTASAVAVASICSLYGVAVGSRIP